MADTILTINILLQTRIDNCIER